MIVPGNRDPNRTSTTDAASAEKLKSLQESGDYMQAAAEAEKLGLFSQASDLYARIWMYQEAASSAQKAGLLKKALEYAIESRDQKLVSDAKERLLNAEENGAQLAAEIFLDKGKTKESAFLFSKIGKTERAIGLFKKSGAYLDAAVLCIEKTRYREALDFLQKALLRADSSQEESQIHNLFARVFESQGELFKAVSHLQKSISLFPDESIAFERLVQTFLAMDLRHAARDALMTGRKLFPTLPASLEGMRASTLDPTVNDFPGSNAKLGGLLAGRYELLKEIGAGSTGRVYQAKDHSSGTQVALKVLHSGHSKTTDSFKRFAREADITASIQHPNIVKTHDFVPELGFLAMEFMEGGSLSARLKSGESLPVSTCESIALDLLDGLQHAHQHGVVHRDIKPQNIFLTAGGRAKIGDFGTAHLLEFGVTQTGGLIGTLAYIAPEQITGAPLTVAADLYSLGVVLFRCLTGRLPFQGPDFIAQHMGTDIPLIEPAQQGSKGLSEEQCKFWNAFLSSVMAKAPGERETEIPRLKRQIREGKQAGNPATVLQLPKAKLRKSRFSRSRRFRGKSNRSAEVSNAKVSSI